MSLSTFVWWQRRLFSIDLFKSFREGTQGYWKKRFIEGWKKGKKERNQCLHFFFSEEEKRDYKQDSLAREYSFSFFCYKCLHRQKGEAWGNNHMRNQVTCQNKINNTKHNSQRKRQEEKSWPQPLRNLCLHSCSSPTLLLHIERLPISRIPVAVQLLTSAPCCTRAVWLHSASQSKWACRTHSTWQWFKALCQVNWQTYFFSPPVPSVTPTLSPPRFFLLLSTGRHAEVMLLQPFVFMSCTGPINPLVFFLLHTGHCSQRTLQGYLQELDENSPALISLTPRDQRHIMHFT